MADKTPISQLPAGALTGANVDVNADYLAIDDVSAGNTKKITPKELIANTSSFVQSGSDATSETVQDALRRLKYVTQYSSLTTALASGTATSSFKLHAFTGSHAFSKLTWPTTYQTTLLGDGSAQTILASTNTDGTQAISVASLGSDRYHAVIESLKLTGGATSGDGIHFNVPVIGPMMKDVWIVDFSGSGKAGAKLTTVFIGTVDNLKVFDCDIGVDLVGSNGIIGRGWWLADNNTMQLQLDSNCKGNDIGCIEIGLASVDTSKKAVDIDGKGNKVTAQYYENFTAARSINFGATALGNTLDFLHSAPWTGAWDDGAFNVYPMENDTPLRNLSSAFGFAGHLLAGGNDIENLYTNSTWNNSATVGWSDFSITPPTRSVDTSIGYLDTNSMKLAWGTTALSGVETSTTFAITAGDIVSVMAMFRADRDLESTESLSFFVLGAANENRAQVNICDLRQDNWTPVFLTYVATTTESITLRISLNAAASHTDLNTYHDDFVIQVNKKTIGLLRNDTASTRSVDKNEGLYIPKARIGQAVVETGDDTEVGIGGTTTDATQASTAADTDETVLFTHSISARGLWKDGQALRIRAWGSNAATANTKQERIRLGGLTGTVVCDTGAPGANNKKWVVEATIIRTGAATQDFCGTAIANGAAREPTVGSGTKDFTTALTLVVTGQNGTAAAADIVYEGATVEYLNMA